MARKSKQETSPTPAQIERRLKAAKKNYKKTIQRFAEERERFIYLYKQQEIIDKREALEEFEKKYFSNFGNNEEDNKYVNEKMEKLSERLLIKLKDCLTDAIQNGNSQELSKLKTIAEQAGEAEKLKGNKEYQEVAEKLFSSEKINQLVWEELNLLFQGLGQEAKNNYSEQQFTDFALGLRRGIFYRLAIQPEAQTYVTPQSIHSVKGYFAEAAVYKGFSELSKELSQSKIGFEVNAIGGENISQDFSFKFNIPSDLSVTGTAEVETFYGQSKSWDTPEWLQKHGLNKSYDYTIGHKAALVAKVIAKYKNAKQSPEYSWTMMVKGLSEDDNAYEAMDKAVIWRLGHEMIWADALMESMINSNRYLSTSFTAKEHKTTDVVRWAARIQKN